MSEVILQAVPNLVTWIGTAAAVLTTICWLPQAVRVVRHKDTRAISLTTNIVFAIGIVLWLIYGLALENWPIICANAISLVLTSVIIAMKLRHG